MSNISMEVRGTNRVRNKLRTAAAKLPDRTEKVVGAWARQTRAFLKSTPYPAKRPGQSYVRTGTLANSWRARRVKDGVWNIENSAEYSGFVVGENQAWMHEGRWWKARDKMQERIPLLTKQLTDELTQDF